MSDDSFVVKSYMNIDCEHDEWIMTFVQNIAIYNVIISLLFDLNSIINLDNNWAFIAGGITNIATNLSNDTADDILLVYQDSNALILPRIFKKVNITLDKVPVIQINRDYMK